MKNVWSVIFNKAIVDSNTNSLSLFDCLEEIEVCFSNFEDATKPKKNIPINFSIVSLWSDENIFENREFNQLIELIDPQNKKINQFSNKPAFEKGKKRLRTIVQINGLGITSEGEYTIVIKYKMGNGNFIVASKIPIDIKFVLNTPIVKKKD